LLCRDLRFRAVAVSSSITERATGELKVGDWLDVDAPSGRIRVHCEGFPLLNWGRENWASIAVSQLPSGIDVRRLIAETAVSGPDR
jgi:hypothetical protein